ncbi:hypothetical protein [Cohnella herbarum]|uniref:Uncharacterized protein n=1 Tax=Cohnella herbarum TaxID=2728023 RepID=A0A7Z2ZMZ9_9BACL|nr:hypothetical protein [Cohnella herbarum]QJD85340.1 hypothetical protein HH215_20625 [Cohnella herbarum]
MPIAAITYTPRQITAFINRAESQWIAVYDSSLNGPSIFIDGDEYKRLPLRFSTRGKILAYFKRNWNARLSAIMLCNLKPILYKTRLYEIVADPGPVPTFVVSLRIVNQTESSIRVRASLSGSDEGNETILYTLSKAGGRLRIVNRSGRERDYRYARCTN